MDFDQNSIPKDLHKLNSVRIVADNGYIAPLTPTGRPIYFAVGPPLDLSSGTVPIVYYPVSDASLLGFGYNNCVLSHGGINWVPQVVPYGQPQVLNPMPSLVANGNSSEKACDGGGDDSTLGMKVKFMCSFGGEILPREADGDLIYVGGETRIVTVRRDVRFNDLVRIMVSISGKSVKIKYQLPENDVDALVSVSNQSDLENMLKECEDSSSNELGKVRVFLIPAPVVDFSDLIDFSDQQDSNQNYFEAVKEILEGFADTKRKESTAISEFSEADAIGTCGQGPGAVQGPLSIGGHSPKESSVHSQDAALKPAGLDQGIYIDSSASALGIPVMSGPPPIMPMHLNHEVERSVSVILPHNHGTEMQLPKVTFPVSSPYMQSYGDSAQENVARTDYVHHPSHLGYPTHIMGATATVVQQQQISPDVPPPQFSATPNMFPALITPQQLLQFDNTSEQRALQVPANYNPFLDQIQDEVAPQNFGGGYGWHPHQEQEVFSEGWMQKQQGAVSEHISRFEDCNLYQHALPHEHSDTISQNQKQISASNMFETMDGHYGLQRDGRRSPEERYITIGSNGEMAVGPQGTSVQLPSQLGKTELEMMRVTQSLAEIFIDIDYAPQKEENFYQLIPQDILKLAAGLQSSIGMVASAIPQTYQDNDVQVSGLMLQMDVNELPESNGGEVVTERWVEDGINQDVNSESARSNKVSCSAEDIKQELQEVETTRSGKMNIHSPLFEDISRLQVIKNTDLEELRELGCGAFGTVYHGKWRGTDVAIKRIHDKYFAGKNSEQDRKRDDFWNEAIILADVHHPNVVAFYGVSLDGPRGSVAFVTEYMVNGSLRTALKKNARNLDKRKQLLLASDIAFGMEYLHGKNIVHFDLKSDNLLVNLRDPHHPICKVADLGLSKIKRQSFISGGLNGTLQWMAPELLDGNSRRVSEKVDVYSFGIVMWELLTGQEPYADLPYGALIGGIATDTLRPTIPESCDPDWRDLMERCWSSEPTQRPSFTEISNQLRAMASEIDAKGQMQHDRR